MTTPLEEAFIDLSNAELKAPQWVINDFIPVGLTVLAGPPKRSYKSTLTIIEACMAARWETYALPQWMRCELGGPTLMFSYEADAGEVSWVVTKGLLIEPKPGYIYVASDPWEFQLDNPGSVARLVEYLDVRKPRLVIMDPFRNMWSGDENDSGEVIQALGPVRKWMHENEAAGIVVHHINKPSPDKENGGMYAMRGSSAIPGLADGIIVIEPTKNEGQIVINTVYKRGQGWRRTVQLGVPGYGWPSRGYEIGNDSTAIVQDLWQGNPSHNEEWVSAVANRTKLQTSVIKEAVKFLHRNNRIALTRQERMYFLGEEPYGR